MITFQTNSEAETTALGEALGHIIQNHSVIAMYGDLGAGKTAFIRGLASGMGLDSRVSSPTFTIVNEYPGKIPLFHFDMYRLGSSDELFEIGWEDYLTRDGVCAVEWSENVSDAFEGDEIIIRIQKISESARIISIEGGCVEDEMKGIAQ